MEAKRLIPVDIARAIAIFLVASYHFQPDGSPGWYNLLQTNIIIFLRMPLFMFVSGYLYIFIEREREKRQKNVAYGTFVWHKFRRLMIPYFFVSSLIIAIKLLSQRGVYVENPVSLSAFYELFYNTTVAGYFMWFAFGLFLIFLVIPHFKTSRKLVVITTIALIIYFLPLEIPPVFSLIQLKSIFVFFCLGCIVADRTALRNLPAKMNVFIPLLVFIALCVLLFHIHPGALRGMVVLFTSITGIMLVLCFSEFLGKLSGKIVKILLVVASCTYTIYLFHTTFMGFAKAVLMKLFHGNIVQNELIFIVSGIVVIATGLIAPILLHLFVERYSKLFSFLIGAKFIGKKKK